jgi:hypothetical protein
MNMAVKGMICGDGKADSCFVGSEGLVVTLNVAHSATVGTCCCLHYRYSFATEGRDTRDYNLFNVTFLSLWARHCGRDRGVIREGSRELNQISGE